MLTALKRNSLGKTSLAQALAHDFVQRGKGVKPDGVRPKHKLPNKADLTKAIAPRNIRTPEMSATMGEIAQAIRDYGKLPTPRQMTQALALTYGLRDEFEYHVRMTHTLNNACVRLNTKHKATDGKMSRIVDLVSLGLVSKIEAILFKSKVAMTPSELANKLNGPKINKKVDKKIAQAALSILQGIELAVQFPLPLGYERDGNEIVWAHGDRLKETKGIEPENFAISAALLTIAEYGFIDTPQIGRLIGNNVTTGVIKYNIERLANASYITMEDVTKEFEGSERRARVNAHRLTKAGEKLAKEQAKLSYVHDDLLQLYFGDADKDVKGIKPADQLLIDRIIAFVRIVLAREALPTDIDKRVKDGYLRELRETYRHPNGDIGLSPEQVENARTLNHTPFNNISQSRFQSIKPEIKKQAPDVAKWITKAFKDESITLKE